ncbi:hypothetical protein BHM03_00054646 [Ensete ventricosum]|nr:hypothetical protein BHM03_00054646 [Ensete ventricosum]
MFGGCWVGKRRERTPRESSWHYSSTSCRSPLPPHWVSLSPKQPTFWPKQHRAVHNDSVAPPACDRCADAHWWNLAVALMNSELYTPCVSPTDTLLR